MVEIEAPQGNRDQIGVGIGSSGLTGSPGSVPAITSRSAAVAVCTTDSLPSA